ncbi:MAG TPA: ligase-associated DNA damage response endonuclease PdeM [Sphingopyxis sp.]|nr:ligase-associated DNA damage response endonuclease PdeM [Sphingopyxis sp.]
MPSANLPRTSFTFGGQRFVALPDRALYWPQQRALIVADLHFEKGSAFAANGQHLPPYDSHDILSRLLILAEQSQAQQIFCLGDSFHDRNAAARMAPDLSGRLSALAAERHICWIAGNHDGLSGSAWGGSIADEILLNGIVLRHESLAHESRPEISGHYHPKLRFSVHGRTLSRPCFLINEKRLMLPAFGSLAGGMDVHNAEIMRLFDQNDCQAMIVADEKLLHFPVKQRRQP